MFSNNDGDASDNNDETKIWHRRAGAVFFSPLMRVDSAAVLCSAALCNLAEVR